MDRVFEPVAPVVTKIAEAQAAEAPATRQQLSARPRTLVALLLALLTGGALWVQLERLMQQVEEGNFRAVDFDNFDEFF